MEEIQEFDPLYEVLTNLRRGDIKAAYAQDRIESIFEKRASQLSIKPLEWGLDEEFNEWMADTVLGQYVIHSIKYSGCLLSIPGKGNQVCKSVEEAKQSAQSHYKELVGECLVELPTDEEIYDIVKLERERFEWSLKAFPEATPKGSLSKAREEIQEIEDDIDQGLKNPVEYADTIMAVFDVASRMGIRPELVMEAYIEKMKINKSRTWKKNSDGSYSHVKSQLTNSEEE